MTKTNPPATSLSDKLLTDLTVVQLKDLCKERNIKGFAHKSKARLIEMIEAVSETAVDGADDGVGDESSQPRESQLEPEPELAAEPVAEAEDSQEQEQDLNSLTIAQLKQICKERGIKGFARKNKSQLLELIESTVFIETSSDQSGVDTVEEEDADNLEMETPLGESESDQLYSEDLDTNQMDLEDSDEELSDDELDSAVDLDDEYHMDSEEPMIEVSDRLILEGLERLDRIENLLRPIADNLQRIAGSLGGS